MSFSTDGDATFSATADHGDGTYSATVTASGTDGIETVTATATPFGSATTTLNEVRAVAMLGAYHRECRHLGHSRPLPDPTAGFGRGVGRRRTHLHLRRRTLRGTLPTVESYDPCTNTWQTLPIMPGGGRAWASATMAPDGRIYVSGGRYERTISSTARLVEVYTPGVGTTPGAGRHCPRCPVNGPLTPAPCADDGRLYVMGGDTGAAPPCGSIMSTDVYTPGTGRRAREVGVRPRPDVARGRASQLPPAPDGRILAIGGADDNCEGYNTVEALRPGAQQLGDRRSHVEPPRGLRRRGRRRAGLCPWWVAYGNDLRLRGEPSDQHGGGLQRLHPDVVYPWPPCPGRGASTARLPAVTGGSTSSAALPTQTPVRTRSTPSGIRRPSFWSRSSRKLPTPSTPTPPTRLTDSCPKVSVE